MFPEPWVYRLHITAFDETVPMGRDIKMDEDGTFFWEDGTVLDKEVYHELGCCKLVMGHEIQNAVEVARPVFFLPKSVNHKKWSDQYKKWILYIKRQLNYSFQKLSIKAFFESLFGERGQNIPDKVAIHAIRVDPEGHDFPDEPVEAIEYDEILDEFNHMLSEEEMEEQRKMIVMYQLDNLNLIPFYEMAQNQYDCVVGLTIDWRAGCTTVDATSLQGSVKNMKRNAGTSKEVVRCITVILPEDVTVSDKKKVKKEKKKKNKSVEEVNRKNGIGKEIFREGEHLVMDLEHTRKMLHRRKKILEFNLRSGRSDKPVSIQLRETGKGYVAYESRVRAVDVTCCDNYVLGIVKELQSECEKLIDDIDMLSLRKEEDKHSD